MAWTASVVKVGCVSRDFITVKRYFDVLGQNKKVNQKMFSQPISDSKMKKHPFVWD